MWVPISFGMGTHTGMKTTLDIADPLLAEAKALAARQATTLRALVEEGLRHVVARARSGARFQLRDARFKLVHYAGEPPQLYDLETDPDELRDLAPDPTMGALLKDREARLRALLDPEAVDARAKADQRAKIAAYGGRDAVVRRGTFDNSPVPGELPAFRHVE